MREEFDLRAWFQARPKETRRAEVTVIASRGALRVLPFCKDAFESGRSDAPNLTLQCFRACLISSGMATWPFHEIKQASKAADTAANITFSVTNRSSTSRASASAIAFAAACRATRAATATTAVERASYAVLVVSSTAATEAKTDIMKLENRLKPTDLLSSSLWLDGQPESVERDWIDLCGNLYDEPAFSFWIRWYEAMRDGIPQNWDMLKEIALIDPKIWDAEDGPERVAELIAEIEARYAPKPEVTEENRAQAKRLAAKPELLGTINEGLARQIEDWISAFLREIGANELPDELKPMEAMPGILRSMAAGAGPGDQNDRIKVLETRIAELEAQVLALNAALTEAKANPKNTIFSDAFKKKAGESLGDWKMWGALASGGWFIFGESTGLTSIQEIITLIKR